MTIVNRLCRHRWLYAFVIGLLIHSCAYHYLYIGRLLTAFVVGILGIVAALFFLRVALRNRNEASYGALLLTGLLWAIWFTLPIERLGIWVRFATELSSYDLAVSQLSAGSEPACVETRACYLDNGPPPRLAFMWGGLIDNWYGIVYDPTHDVARIERFRELFGGDLIWCDHVAKDYFLCGFT